MKFTFTPSAKQFVGSVIMRTRDFEADLAAFADGGLMIDGKPLTGNVVAYCAAFGLKQILANSYASAGTAKNKSGGLLSQKEREALWQASFDKRLDKLLSGTGDWTTVFSESGAPRDPFGAECNRIAVAELAAWAKGKGKTLPKGDEYKAMVARWRAKYADRIESEARRRLAEIEAIDIGEDFDFDDLAGNDIDGDESAAE